MKFRTLIIENFLAISKASIQLDDRGLLLVQGVNEDDTSAVSNGAGKSSLADALCWCLYGVTARGETGDAIINSEAGKNTRVRVLIEDGEIGYVVTRYRKHKEGKNSLTLARIVGDDFKDLTLGTDKLTQPEVEKVIGCPYEVFCGAIYAGQDRMPNLPAMTDKTLKMLVEEAAGTTRLERAYEIARTRFAVAKSKVERLEADIERLIEQHTQRTEDIAGLEKRRDAFEEARKEEIRSFTSTAKAHFENAWRLKEEIDRAQVPKLEAELAECRAKLDAVAGEREAEKGLVDEIAAAERDVARLQAEATRLRDEAERQKKSIDGISETVGKPCGECGKAYHEEDLAEAKKLAVGRLRKTVELFKSKKAELERAVDVRRARSDALEAHRASMTDVTAVSAQCKELERILRDVASLEHKRDAEMKLGREAMARAASKKSEANPFDEPLEKMRADLVRICGARLERAAELISAKAGLELAEEAVKVFGPAGVRAQILDTVTPFLNERTAAYLGTLSDGNIEAAWSTLSRTAKGELREKFCIEVKNLKGGASFGLVSGGEKQKVRLACILALQDLVASRATKPIDLFIGDEIDDALDPAGLERLMSVLEEKARERGTVLIISHNDLKDWIRDSLIIRKRGGKAFLEAA